ncbi:hypothetical protein GNX18_09645 [Microbulbifer sp. SH-1]|uniref:metallophosphoesterase n=1 Tax=Microbulbifer sp. SH-1 TaxID=2681547 RepID=UPI001409AEDB|nr:metallophosphoesterase [Microbulbifer sp. SH-1]QIL89988.1 hypothetical protein GNX18_09645 [Microbulbifer sp. SH-1]
MSPVSLQKPRNAGLLYFWTFRIFSVARHQQSGVHIYLIIFLPRWHQIDSRRCSGLAIWFATLVQSSILRMAGMSTYWSVECNSRGRDFVVGDVHGHKAQLQAQLDALEFNPGADRLFFVGDIVDRGPDSAGLVEMIDQRTYISILGNHEAMLIAGFEDPGLVELHQANGGAWFYALPRSRQRAIVEQVREWPWALDIGVGEQRIGLVHADVPGSDWELVKKLLGDISQAWSAGAPLSDERLALVTRPLMWQRTLVTRLYQKVLGLGSGNRTVSEDKRAFEDRKSRLLAPEPALVRPFQVRGIDAVYMGHTFVPTVVNLGNCYFLDSYRGGADEELSIQCISAH